MLNVNFKANKLDEKNCAGDSQLFMCTNSTDILSRLSSDVFSSFGYESKLDIKIIIESEDPYEIVTKIKHLNTADFFTSCN